MKMGKKIGFRLFFFPVLYVYTPVHAKTYMNVITMNFSVLNINFNGVTMDLGNHKIIMSRMNGFSIFHRFIFLVYIEK